MDLPDRQAGADGSVFSRPRLLGWLWCVGFGLMVTGSFAGSVRINLSAPTYAGQRVLLYRTIDLITLRTELIANTVLDAHGATMIEVDASGTSKASLRIGDVSGDLWMRAGNYTIEFPALDAKTIRSMNGTAHVDLVFKDLDPLDINALVGDLNERLDAFIAEDLATDRAAGMQALDIARKEGGTLHPDSAKRPGTLFITPSWSTARVDSFEMKLRKFYKEVKDPWFWQDLDYGIAGLRFGPRANDKELFDRYLKNKSTLYDVPEFVRFIGSFFEDHIMRYPFRSDAAALTHFIKEAQVDSVKKLFAKHDFLQSDPGSKAGDRLCELVMMNELYKQYPGKTFDRAGIRKILDQLSANSSYAEHKRIAANMVWDLITMRIGGLLPSLVLRDTNGDAVHLDSLLHDATCIAITASWCTYCEQEMVALEELHKEYGNYVQFISISLDKSWHDLAAYANAHPKRDWRWLYGGDDPTIMDMLRIRSIPAFFLVNDSTLAQAPAPPPSNGMAAIMFRIKAQADEQNKLRPDDGQHPPKR